MSAPGIISNPVLGNKLQEFQDQALSGNATSYFAKIIPNLVTLGFMLGSIISFFWLLWGGIRWITAGGDKSNYENAQKHITQAIIGLAILFGLIALFKLLEAILDIHLLTIDFDPIFIK